MSESTPENITLRIIYLSPQQALREEHLRNVYHTLGIPEKPSLRYLRLVEHLEQSGDVYRLTREGRAVAIKTETTPELDAAIKQATAILPRVPKDNLIHKLLRALQ